MLHFQMYEDLINPTAEENEQPPSMVIQQDTEQQDTEPQVKLQCIIHTYIHTCPMSHTSTFNKQTLIYVLK